MTMPNKCTSLIRDVLEIQLHDLDTEGALKEVYDKKFLPFVQTRSFLCDEDESSGTATKPEPLGLDTMSGIFILHAFLVSIALLLWYCN